MFYIGVDLGTSAVKALLMDEKGNVTKISSREYPLYINADGWSDQEPEDWWEQTAEALKELVDGIDASEIQSVSFSGQMHGLVLLDKNDNVIRRAILWNDQRTANQCEYLNNVIGREKLIDNTANVALTGFTAPKILWVKENEPENFTKIAKIMLPKDYIAYKLSGVHATDYSDASGMLLLDVKNKKWSPFMLNLIGIDEGKLAKLFPSYGVIGAVTEEASSATNLPAGVKVVIGGGDQAVGAVGSGTVVNNMCSVSLGTSGVVFVSTDNFKVDYSASALHSFCHSTGKYHMMGVTLAAAGSNKWWVEDILKTINYSAEQTDIKELGNNRVFFLPYLNGERTPKNDPDARGAFVGMSMATSRHEMTQAVMEGVTFSLRDTLTIVRKLGVDVNTARIYGGGAKSPLWCQMTADIMNVRVEKINSAEGPALGAAILAAVGAGAYDSIEDACAEIIKVTEVFEPNTQAVKSYNKKYEIFVKLYDDLKDTFKEISLL
ncbi:MAG: xylulokinase [Clostridiales bacterium]|jgi:xylulokinase|nr:xylulokinase [Clostridiales bacterium]